MKFSAGRKTKASNAKVEQLAETCGAVSCPAGLRVVVRHRLRSGLSEPADRHGGAIRRRRHVRRHGPHHRGAHERTPAQTVVVSRTRRARGGIVGVNRVDRRRRPDGYTILLGIDRHARLQPDDLQEAPLRRRSTTSLPVTLFSEQPMVLEARKDLSANTIPGVRRAGEAATAPRCSFGSAGVGLHHPPRVLRCSYSTRAGVNATHVPYRGSAPAIERSDRRPDRLSSAATSRCRDRADQRQAGRKRSRCYRRRRTPLMPELADRAR